MFLSSFSMRLLIVVCLSVLITNSKAQISNSCWAMQLDGNDPQWMGYHRKNIGKAVKLSDGFVIVGVGYNHIFPSRDGDTVGRTNWGGVYVAKYDFDGNLQWMDYGIDSLFDWGNMIYRIQLPAVTADSNDNIYIAGRLRSRARFFYNDGQSFTRIAALDTTSPNVSSSSFVAKLDKYGQVKWRAHVMDSNFDHLAYSSTGELVVAGSYPPPLSGSVDYFTNNGQSSVQILAATSSASLAGVPQYILWLDTTNGQLIRNVRIEGNNINHTSMLDMTTDLQGNVIFTGVHEGRMKLYSAGQTSSLVMNGALFGERMYVAKYNASGQPQWYVSDGFPISGGYYLGSQPHNITVAPNGTIYLATNRGEFGFFNSTYRPVAPIIFYNKDSSSVTYPFGDYSLISISANGFFNWSAHGGLSSAGGITFRNNEIDVSGYSHFYFTSNLPSCDSFFDGTGSGYFVLPNENPNLVLARYDTLGHIINVTKTGNSYRHIYWSAGMINTDAGAVLMYGDAQPTSGTTDSIVFYSDTLRYNGIDGYMVKVTPGICDTVNVPTLSSHIYLGAEPDTLLCAGDMFAVVVNTTGNFKPGNIFSVEISDANGIFGNPQTVGSYAGINTDTIVAVVPGGLPNGSGYRIRVHTTDSVYTTQPNAVDIEVVSAVTPSVSIMTDPPLPYLQGSTITFKTLPVNGGFSPGYQWKLNGISIPGAIWDTLTTNTLANSDVVSVSMTSSKICANPMTVNSSITVITGIDSIGNNDVINIYPNPCNGSFVISGKLNGVCAVEVISTTGVRIYDMPVNSKLTWRGLGVALPPGIPPGIYYVRVKTRESLMVKKLIVK